MNCFMFSVLKPKRWSKATRVGKIIELFHDQFFGTVKAVK